MHVCPRCRRANPADAVFCHFDGAELRPAPGGAAQMPPGWLPHPFVFPTGRRCGSFDELIQACQEDWAAARDLLRQGVFRQFLASVGRTDLALLAREALGQPDLDLALTAFLGGLPGTTASTPRLELNPRRLLVGTLHPGETRQVRLTVSNQGQGMLHGTMTVVGGTEDTREWLRLADGTGSSAQCTIRTAKEQQIVLQVDTTGLPAGLSCAAKLTVITNGGVVEVPVRVELASDPFPWAPFEGAGTQRELAERMRAQPKAAVPLLEGGQIASWFLANGWTYPVQGTPVRGVAAVQQFFECMGLSRAPAVEVSETEVRMKPVHPEVVRWQVNLFTKAKKWVYGQAESDSLWLKVLTPTVSGPQQAAVAFEVDSSLMEPNRIYSGQLQIVANAGQTMNVHVRVDVRRGKRSLVGRLFRALLIVTLVGVLVRLLLVPLADLYLYEAAADQAAEAYGTQPDDAFAHPEYLNYFVKYFIAGFVLWTWWIGAVVGVAILWRRGAGWQDLSCGAVAGAVAGLIVSASFACMFLVIDRLPQSLWEGPQGVPVPAGLGALDGFDLFSWLMLADGCWAALGAVLGVLAGLIGHLRSLLLTTIKPVPAPILGSTS